MDILGGHLLYDQASRLRRGDSFQETKPKDLRTPSKDPQIVGAITNRRRHRLVDQKATVQRPVQLRLTYLDSSVAAAG
jgi:hypothetical protein